MQGIIDIHSHILPGLDDGASNMEETIAMLGIAYEQGIRKMVATPHYHLGRYESTISKIEQSLEQVRMEVKRQGILMELVMGNEIYYHSEAIRDVGLGNVSTLGGSSCVLVEFSPGSSLSYVRQALDFTIREGYTPVVAHVERYIELTKDIDDVAGLIDMGCYIQMNAGSIAGNAGMKIKSFCKKLLKNELVHFIATDCHGVNSRTPELKKCVQYIIKKFGDDYAKKLFIENPETMLSGEYL